MARQRLAAGKAENTGSVAPKARKLAQLSTLPASALQTPGPRQTRARLGNRALGRAVTVAQQPRQPVGRLLRGTHHVTQTKPDLCIGANWYDAETVQPGKNAHDDAQIIAGFEKLLKAGFDDWGTDLDTTAKKNARAAISRLRGAAPSMRSIVGLGNPPHNRMLDLFESANSSPRPAGRPREDFLMSPSRHFVTSSPNSRQVDPHLTQGHSNVVMGHDEGASNYWNREGHKLPPSKLREYNRELDSYHGLEQRAKSNKSGGGTPRFVHPSRALGSWAGYWDSNHSDFDPRYRLLWPQNIE